MKKQDPFEPKIYLNPCTNQYEMTRPSIEAWRRIRSTESNWFKAVFKHWLWWVGHTA